MSMLSAVSAELPVLKSTEVVPNNVPSVSTGTIEKVLLVDTKVLKSRPLVSIVSELAVLEVILNEAPTVEPVSTLITKGAAPVAYSPPIQLDALTEMEFAVRAATVPM